MLSTKYRYAVVIPARGGSKRLPGKNIRDFCGEPLIAFSIRKALENFSSNVFVTTDDDSIAEVSLKYGASVIRRPDALSSDSANTASVIIHAVGEIKKKGMTSDAVITLQPTNPLRAGNLIKDAIEAFELNYTWIDSLVTVSKNFHKLGKIEDTKFQPITYAAGQRSQDLESLYYENGLLYITKIKPLIKLKSIMGRNTYPFITEGLYSRVDIDTLEDFEIAKLIYMKYNGDNL